LTCRSCGTRTETVLDLGDHYLPDFTDPGEPRGPKYPLRLEFCAGCTLLQLDETAPRDALYHERYGFKSGVNEAIRADLADVVRYALDAQPGARSWLDIACNDGTLLAEVRQDVYRAGIDPLRQFAEEAGLHADEIVSDFFRPEYFGRPFDVITSVSMFYDLDDPIGFAKDVASVLADDGVWVIQQNYAAAMLSQNAVDNLCHEHVTYFSVTSLIPVLAAAGLEVSDVAYSDVNGGCFRTLVSREGGGRGISRSVRDALAAEKAMGLGEAATYVRWAEEVRAELAKTRELLERAKAAGERVLVYGASTRGGTILQMIGAGPELLPAAVERNPAKVGKVMAATGIPIISEEEMRADPPEYLFISPWFFSGVFVEREAAYLKQGGRMIFPLPRFRIVGE
jgi:hypothetical protein